MVVCGICLLNPLRHNILKLRFLKKLGPANLKKSEKLKASKVISPGTSF